MAFPLVPVRLPASLRLVRESDGAVVSERLERADTFGKRFFGLMGRKTFEGALWIEPCSSIHMMFVRFAIDAVFVDAEGRVLEVVRGVRPWIGFAACSGARAVIEFLEGGAAKVSPGDRLVAGGGTQ